MTAEGDLYLYILYQYFPVLPKTIENVRAGPGFTLSLIAYISRDYRAGVGRILAVRSALRCQLLPGEQRGKPANCSPSALNT